MLSKQYYSTNKKLVYFKNCELLFKVSSNMSMLSICYNLPDRQIKDRYTSFFSYIHTSMIGVWQYYPFKKFLAFRRKNSERYEA